MAEETLPVQTGTPKNGPALELRAWVRLRSEQDISCQKEELVYTWSGSIQEVSSGGITLNLRRRFEPGTVLNVELAPNANGPRCLVLRVVHATQQTNGRWIIGCAFDRPLSAEELQAFFEE
jgi:hypothetical protein